MTGRIRRRIGAVARGDQGFTLSEVLVVMVVLGFVLAIVQGATIAAQRTTSDIASRVDAAQNGRQAIDTMSRNLRTAVLPEQLTDGDCTSCSTTAFVKGTPTSVQFFANNNNDQTRLGPSKVSYTLNAKNELIETIQKPNPHAATNYNYVYCNPGPSCAVQSRVIARNVKLTGAQRLFTYFDRTGTAMTSNLLSVAQLSAVDSIDLLLPVARTDLRQQQSAPKIVTLTQRVALPNADTVPEPETT